MHQWKWMGWIIGTSLIGSGLSAFPANAMPPNQSDVTGTNIWNSTAPIFENGGKLSPEILDNAKRLTQELANASERCRSATPSAVVRRFARGPGNPNEGCIHPDCQKLNSLVEETKAFLSEVNRSQDDQQRESRNRTW